MRALRSLLLVTVLLAVVTATAQDQPSATVNSGQHESLGTYLVDDDGRSLYIYTEDAANTSNCYDQCAINWPPLTVEEGDPSAGTGVAPTLLGVIEREDGLRQVTYFGKPLYYFIRDAGPGDTSGHGAAGVWYLVSPYGTALPVPKEEPATEQQPESAEATGDISNDVMAAGGEIFSQYCVACHGPSGEGGHGGGPALTNESRVRSEGQTITQVLRGSSYMPSFGNALDDQQVSALVTFIRNSWGHEFGLTTPEEVADQRQ